MGSERFVGDSLSAEARSCLSFPPADAELLNEAARSHRAAENSLHRARDVTFDEDRGRIRKEDAPEDFGRRRRPALCPRKRDTASTGRITGQRLRASWDEGYSLQVPCGSAEN